MKEQQGEFKAADGEEEEAGRLLQGRVTAFAAWTVLEAEAVSGKSSGKSSITEVLAICGPSHCLLPMGKNLLPEDTAGCIIGAEVAEELFGTSLAEGQQLCWNNRELTVRGVREDIPDFMMVQADGKTAPAHFDRISLIPEKPAERKLAGERFITQYGLSARMLRYDHYCSLSWLAELVPAGWSDFDGWKQNIKEHQEAVELVKKAGRSAIEEAGMDAAGRKTFCYIAAFVLIFGVLFFLYPVPLRLYRQLRHDEPVPL